MADTRPCPTLRFVYSHPAHFIAFGAGVGLLRPAPGTWGTLLAWPLHVVLAGSLGAAVHLGCIALLFLLGIWACGYTGHSLGRVDHGGIVFDEVVAFLLVLFFVPQGPYWLAFGFMLFRLFDISKPPPIRQFDRKLKNGFGVMFDDILAAGYTLLCLALFKAWLN